ncbi:MAG: nicotinate phosphoribosyltransferase, partial [Acetatifactor sp.]|nr:nicotinate phosphoribosyltransferase [Acetatifactor sp.]
SYTLRPLMEQIFRAGQCCYASPKVMDIRSYCQSELNTLWDETKRLVNPHQVYVDLSQRLYDTKLALLEEMSGQ